MVLTGTLTIHNVSAIVPKPATTEHHIMGNIAKSKVLFGVAKTLRSFVPRKGPAKRISKHWRIHAIA